MVAKNGRVVKNEQNFVAIEDGNTDVVSRYVWIDTRVASQ